MIAFCRHSHARLVGLIALHVGDRAVAEELAQDVLLRVCERWESIREPEAWANRLAVNLSRSWWRRRYAEWRANARQRPAQHDHGADTTEALAVRDAVSRLPERQRLALVYRYYARFSVAETAAAMGCAEGTVKALTHQAIAALRERGDLAPGAHPGQEESTHV